MKPLERCNNIKSQFPKQGLFENHEWRCSPDPLFLDENLLKQIQRLGQIFHSFNQACNRLYHASVAHKQPAWIAQWLDAGKPPALLELSRHKIFKNKTPLIIRPDLLMTDHGLSLCELDSVPGGIGATTWLQETYASLFPEIAGETHGMRQGWQTVFPEGDIVISQEASTYRPEMQWLNQDSPQIQIHSAETYFATEKPIYRFFELFDIPNLANAPQWFETLLEGNTSITPPIKPFLEEKMWFALFWMKPLQNFWRMELGEKNFQLLQEIIPYTWILNPDPLPPQAVHPRLEIQSWEDLFTFSQKQRRLVIKISGFSPEAWGARGVTFGHDISATEWKSALQQALGSFPQQPYLLQIFENSQLHTTDYLEEKTNTIQSMSSRARLCPYYFVDDKDQATLGGILATLVPSDKKAIHGMRDAVMTTVAKKI